MGRPVYATLPNSYKEVKDATLAWRTLRPSSTLAKSCEALARKAASISPFLPETKPQPLLRKLGLSTA